MQAFTNFVHSYNHEHNMHANNNTQIQKSVHGIDSSMLKLLEFANLFVLFFLPCTWMILSCITSCEGHKLWKLSKLVLSICHIWELLFIPRHRLLWFKKIRTATTAVFLISNTVIPDLYSHNIVFDPQFFTQLSEVPEPLSRSVSVW